MRTRAAGLRSLLALALLGGAAGSAHAQAAGGDQQRLFTRQADCSTTWLDTVKGQADAECFFLAQPASEAFHVLGPDGPHRPVAGGPLVSTYEVRGSSTRLLNPARPAAAHVEVEHVGADTGGGVGLTTVDVSVVVTGKGGADDVLGTVSASQLTNPLGSTAFDLDVPLPARIKGVPVRGLTLRVELRGVSAPHAVVAHGGATWLDVPLARRTR